MFYDRNVNIDHSWVFLRIPQTEEEVQDEEKIHNPRFAVALPG